MSVETKTVSFAALFFLCFVCLILGSVLTRLYYENQLSSLLFEKNEALKANESLVKARVELENELDEAQKKASSARQVIYARNPKAREWAAATVPDELSDRVLDAAKAVDAASRE